MGSKSNGVFSFTEISDAPLIAFSTIFVVISAIAAPLETYLLGKIFLKLAEFLAGAYPNSDEFLQRILFLCGKIVICGVGHFIFLWIGVIGWLIVGERAQIRGRKKIFGHILGEDLELVQSHHNLVGSLTQAHRCIEEIRIGVSENLGVLIQSCASIVFLLVTSMISLWLLTLVVLASAPLMVASTSIFGGLIVKFKKSENQMSSEAAKTLHWCFNFAAVTRILNGKYYDLAAFKEAVEKSAVFFIKESVSTEANSSILRALGGFVFIQGLAFAQHLVAHGKSNAGQVFTAFGACLLLGSLIASLAGNVAILNNAQGSARTIDQFGLLGSISSLPSGNGEPQFDRICTTLELRHVAFKYSQQDTTLLNDICAIFRNSAFNFVIGESGCGKSTLASIIAGLYKETLGNVLYNGKHSSDLNSSALEEAITYIDLSPAIFKKLIKDNVILGFSNVNDDDLNDAVRFSGLESFIESYSEGVNAIIDSNALSGGQTQKIGLARAFIRNSPILILDEALSAIDYLGRNRIMMQLRELRKDQMTILITHDSEEICNNDVVLCLQLGRVVGSGKKSDIPNDILSKFSSTSDSEKSAYLKYEINTLESSSVEFTDKELNCDCTSKREFAESNDGSETTVKPFGIRAVISFAAQTSTKKLLITMGLLASVATGLVPPVLSYLFSKLLSKIIAQNSSHMQLSFESNVWLVIPPIIVIVADGFIHFGSKVCLHYSLERWIVSLRKRCLSIISDQDMSFFGLKHLSPSNLSTLLMNDTRDLRCVVSELLPRFLELIALALGGIIWSLITGWQLTLIGFSFVPVVLIFSSVYNLLVQRIEFRYKAHIALLEDHCNRTINGMKTIRSLGITRYWLVENDAMLQQLMPLGVRRAVLIGFGVSFLPLCTSCASAIILYYGVLFVSLTKYTQEQMLHVLTMLIFTLSGASALAKSLPRVSRGQRAAFLISKVLSCQQLQIEVGGDLQFLSSKHVLDKTLEAVTFKNVSFSYPNLRKRNFEKVLQNVSFLVNIGESVCLVGPSGCGKSTIVSLLLRLYDTDRGSIEVYGRSIRDVEPDFYKSKVTMVPQNCSFFDGTIRENLTYGNQNTYIPEELILGALNVVNALGIIDRLPNGLDSIYGSLLRFSLGELQRLAIARALIRKPKVIIFDEPTSHLDQRNTDCIIDLIASGLKDYDDEMTIITISHNPEVMKKSQKILVLQNGSLCQSGKFSELVNVDGPLKRLLSTSQLA